MAQKLGRKVRELIKKEIDGAFSNKEGFILSSFDKIKASDINGFRRKAKLTGSRYLLVKKTLSKKALEDIGLAELSGVFEGRRNVAVMTVPKDPVPIAKILKEFAKANENFVIAGGYIDKQVLTADKIKVLADLPAREQLIAMAVGAMKAPINNFVFALSAILRNFCCVLTAIKDKKEKHGTKNDR